MPNRAILALTSLAILVAPVSLRAQTGESVAVVINDASGESQRIGEYYARKRAVPQANVIHLSTPSADDVSRPVFAATIEAPIASALSRRDLQDRVLYIVLTKGIPLRIAGTAGDRGTVASVDSELTLLYRRMTGRPAGAEGPLPNPYFLGTAPVTQARRFTHATEDIYLVTRIDAFTVDEALGLVDKASAPVTHGRILLDERDTLQDRTGENWLDAAGARLRAMGQGDRVLLDTNAKGVRDASDVLGYYSWGSNDPTLRVRRIGIGFEPGALAATYVNSDARTFQEPPASWQPSGNSRDQKAWWAGSPQSLTGDLVREGATGAAGHVADPSLAGAVRPQVLFPAYLSGFNLAESFYLAIPYLSWQTVVVGDPLCRPFRGGALTRADVDPPMDPAMELPRFFARRLAESLRVRFGLSAASDIVLAVRGQARLARGDRAGARAAFLELSRTAPASVAAQQQVAVLLAEDHDYDGAIQRYRQVLRLQPGNPAALNNLAYLLAVEKKNPKEAKPFIDEAIKAAPANPIFLDTAGWIAYLLGDHATASKLLAQAVNGLPLNADVRLHAAFAYAASGARAAAINELDVATKLNPALADRPDVAQLKKTLSGGS